MYYKVIKNNRVIDLLNQLVFLKYQPKHEILLVCGEDEAQAILSSDEKHVWHVSTLPRPSGRAIDTVDLVEIDQYEYEHLLALNLKTPEEIIDEYTLSLIEEGIL